MEQRIFIQSFGLLSRDLAFWWAFKHIHTHSLHYTCMFGICVHFHFACNWQRKNAEENGVFMVIKFMLTAMLRLFQPLNFNNNPTIKEHIIKCIPSTYLHTLIYSHEHTPTYPHTHAYIMCTVGNTYIYTNTPVCLCILNAICNLCAPSKRRKCEWYLFHLIINT